MIKNIVVYGSGGFAREISWLIHSFPDQPYKVVCYIDDNVEKHGAIVDDIEVLGLEQARMKYPDAKLVGAIGTPGSREKVMYKAMDSGFEFISFIHPNVVMSERVEIGTGVLICAGNILTTNIHIGDHVHINLDCTIGHDVKIGDYATLAPGVHLSGNVHIGNRVYIGTGANIINGTEDSPLIIENDAIVGAGACVIKNVTAGDTVVGIPAKSIQKR